MRCSGIGCPVSKHSESSVNRSIDRILKSFAGSIEKPLKPCYSWASCYCDGALRRLVSSEKPGYSLPALLEPPEEPIVARPSASSGP